jgi:Ca2+-binding RTX toxin-like protein
MPLDLFRMRPGDGDANFAGRNRVLCTGSIIARQVVYDGGVWDPTGITTIPGLTDGDVPVSTGANHGDNHQASHWKDDSLINNIVIGSMDPVAPSSGVVEVRNEDRRAMGLIGWDVSSAGAILLQNGSLTVNGTSGDDTISVGVNGGIVTATIDGVNGFFNSASTSSIDVDALAGDDYILGSARKDSLIGGLGNDTLVGGAEDDTLIGADGDDRLEGGSDQDLLSGGNDNDTMLGGSSGDIFAGGSNTDTVDYSDSIVNLVITAQDNVANDGATGEGDNVESDVENVVGGGGDDVIYGNTLGNILVGGTGNDYLDGKDGNDTLNGAGGNDTLVGSNGTDSMTGDAGNDIFYLADSFGFHDSAWGGSGTDTLGSSDSDDSFFQ